MTYSLQDLVDAVNRWCLEHGLVPANGQAAEQLNIRALRYYRHLGLLDPPADGSGSGYSEQHLLQLQAIRLLQGNGLPLQKIQQLLYGRPLPELRKIVQRGLQGIPAKSTSEPILFNASEAWRLYPLNEDFVLIARNEPQPTPEQLAAIRKILNGQTIPHSKNYA